MRRFFRNEKARRVLIALLLGLFVFGLVAAALHHHDHDHGDGDHHQNCPVCIVGWVVVLIVLLWTRWGFIARREFRPIEHSGRTATSINLLLIAPPRGPPISC